MPDHLNRSPCPILDSAPATTQPIYDRVESFEVQPITDAAGGLRRISGVAKEADKINLNRYYFSEACCQDMVDAAQEPMAAGELIGLVQHPEFWSEGAKGRIENIGIRFDKLYMDGKLMRFEGVMIATARGRDLQAVVDAGVKVGMSTNVSGVMTYQQASEVDPNWPDPDEWIGVVQTGARLTTIDAVMTPADHAGDMQAADAHDPHRRDTVKDLKELKEKHPDIYAQAIADGKRQAEAEGDSVEAQLATERAARLKLEQRLQDDARKGIATQALTDAKLPKLGKAGDIDLDARFEKRVTDAALRAENDEEARAEVGALIAERRITTKDAQSGGGDNNPGVPRKDQHADSSKKASGLVSSARAGLGLT